MPRFIDYNEVYEDFNLEEVEDYLAAGRDKDDEEEKEELPPPVVKKESAIVSLFSMRFEISWNNLSIETRASGPPT